MSALHPVYVAARTTVEGHEIVVPVDLIVPEGAATGGGRRGARLGAHGRRAARRALGLEAALADRSPMEIAALESGDRRVLSETRSGALAETGSAAGRTAPVSVRNLQKLSCPAPHARGWARG